MKTNKFEKLDGGGLKIAIIQARFNPEITKNLTDGAVRALKEAGVSEKNIKIYEVPGSFEIPLFCQAVARKKKFHGLIAVGAVIQGKTAHFEYIAKAATDGILRVMLDYQTPIAFAVMTAYNLAQAEARSRKNDSNKGYEAALSLVEMAVNLKKIK